VGSNFDPGSTLSFSGTGITVTGYISRTTTKLIARLTIDFTAPIGAHDVIITNPDSSKGSLNGGFTVNKSNGFLTFPLMNKTAFTAAVNAIFDHDMRWQYCSDTSTIKLVTAYTGEYGNSNFQAFLGNTLTCPLPPNKTNDLYGYAQDNVPTSSFSINGQYTGAHHPHFLFYDGHPGFDYRTTDQNLDGSWFQRAGLTRGLSPFHIQVA
jgi:hypothetical protein